MRTEEIGHNALRLWQLMNDGTVWCYRKIREASRLSDREINSAIGWLAREDTLEIEPDPVSQEDTFMVRHSREAGI